jgi:hypothetical protein
MTTMTARVGDPLARRELREKVRREVDLLRGDDHVGDRLARVVWELVTNLLEHGGSTVDDMVFVEIEMSRVTIRLPGPCYDSVTRACCDGARGLDSTAWRLERCGWSWSHRHANGVNEVWLEERSVSP